MLVGFEEVVASLDPKGLNNIAMAPRPMTTNPDTSIDEFTDHLSLLWWGVECFGLEIFLSTTQG